MNWDIAVDGLFSESYRKDHVLLPEFVIPEGMQIRRAYDHGMTSPFEVLYYIECNGEELNIDGRNVVFPRGSIILVHEYHGAKADDPKKGLNLSDREIGQAIKNFERRHFGTRQIHVGPADAAIYIKDNNLHSPVEAINEGYYGRKMLNDNALFTPFWKGHKTRVNGYSRMRTMMKSTHGWKTGKFLESPGLFVVDTCQQWLRCIPNAPRDEKNFEDCTRAYRDEAMDVTRYIVLSDDPTIGVVNVRIR